MNSKFGWMINGASDRFAIAIYDGSWNVSYGSTVPNTTSWWHVAFTYDGTTGKLYVNGLPEGSDLVNTITDDIGKIAFGATYEIAPLKFHDGLIDDVRIYNRALSAGEVSTLAASAPTDCAAVAVTPDTTATGRLPSNGTNYTVDLTVVNEGSATGRFRSVDDPEPRHGDHRGVDDGNGRDSGRGPGQRAGVQAWPPQIRRSSR